MAYSKPKKKPAKKKPVKIANANGAKLRKKKKPTKTAFGTGIKAKKDRNGNVKKA